MRRIGDVRHVTAAGEPMGDGLVTFGALVSFTYILGIGLAVGAKQIAEPRCLVRFYSVDSARGMRFAMTWDPRFLGVSLVCVMGLGALVHAWPTSGSGLSDPPYGRSVGFMLAKFDNPWVSGLCIMGLFAAGMSSLASVMLIVGTAAVGDIWNVYRPMSAASVVRMTKLAIAAYSVVVFLCTVFPPAGIVELTSFSGAVFAAGFFPAVFGGLYLRWGTGHGAFWSMLIGMLTCVAWRFFFRFEYATPARRSRDHSVVPDFSGGISRNQQADRLESAGRTAFEARIRSLRRTRK